MCPASASSASEPATTPKTTSPAISADDQDERNREGAPPGAAVRVVVAGHATHCGFTALRQASHLPGAEDFALLRSRYGLRAREEKRAGPALAGNGSAPDLADDEAAL